METRDLKEQHDSEEQTEGHSVRFEVAIIQAALIRINISRINHTNIINKDTIKTGPDLGWWGPWGKAIGGDPTMAVARQNYKKMQLRLPLPLL